MKDDDGQGDRADVEDAAVEEEAEREQKVLSFKVSLSFWQQVVGSSSSSLLWKVSSSVQTLITTRKLILEMSVVLPF